jgi:formate hydrogenlyase transcriptional activator
MRPARPEGDRTAATAADARLRRIIDTIPVLAFCTLADGANEFTNKGWQDYTGLSQEDTAGWGWQVAVHPEDLPAVLDRWRSLIRSGDPGEVEGRLRRSDGVHRWFLIRVEPLRDETGNVLRWYGTCTDIEDLKRAQAAATAADAQLRRIIDTIPVLAWCNLPDGSNEFLNQRWQDYAGLSQQEASGWGWQGAFHPDDLPLLMERWRVCLSSGEADEVEARLRRRDGVYRWFLIRVEPFRDELGNIVRWYGTSTDIDDLKRAQVELLRDQEELRRIPDAIPQIIIVLSPEGVPLYTNRVACDYTGVTLEDVGAEYYRARIFHPEDVERVREQREAALSRPVPFSNEQRALGRDGRYRWFLVHYNPLLDAEARIVRWYAMATDIDDRKRAEERAHEETLALREEVDKASMFEEIVGHSSAIRTVLKRVARVAPTESTVLITGETGTGKELVARAIHKRSGRSARAFVSVNCAAIPQALISSELFGHEKGAFTGALQRRLGRFELAEGGTLFLDEVGELPPETQVALLRVLQEREFERVGGMKPIHADVRVVAATNRDLQAAIRAGTVRSDLFYRLNVFPIDIPPLRERQEDIPVLVEYFVDRYASKAGKKIRTIGRESMELLRSYSWPGNIRELQNVIERSLIVCDADEFSVDESWLASETSSSRNTRPQDADKIAAQADERATIQAALAETKGRISGPLGAAAKLGMPASTLDSKIRSLGINKHRFKTI